MLKPTSGCSVSPNNRLQRLRRSQCSHRPAEPDRSASQSHIGEEFMFSATRRAILVSGLSLATPLVRAVAAPAGAPKAPADAESQKREIIRQANSQWQAAHKKAVAAAKAAERRGRFSSLAPPQALIPFKDWDYYYTRGISRWKPNAGQRFKAVNVPDGFVTDLASIPQQVWSFGLRPEGPYTYAAVIHDFLYWMQDRPREEADEIFLTAMADSRVDEPLRSRIYKAVRLEIGGGSAWKKNAELKRRGEKRLLKKLPADFTITWSDWKRRPDVFQD